MEDNEEAGTIAQEETRLVLVPRTNPAEYRQVTKGLLDDLVSEAEESVMELILKRFP